MIVPHLSSPILALDVGDKRIGMAVCGEARRIATPLGTIRRKGLARDLAVILECAAQQKAGLILVGLPISLSGALGPQAHRTLVLCDTLRKAIAEHNAPFTVETWDERYTSVEAERLIRQAGGQPSRDKSWLDACAAAVILQSYLDFQQRKQPSAAESPPAPPASH
ncbi:MAG: Holliday junction resolvase RuvX [Chloroflexi bacterium]|nr:Holliday junction resolvase RuvX [Chloroflexota bacterium]